MTLLMYKSALDWLGKGFHLLPIQPGTKKQVQGFGLHQSRVTNIQHAAAWWKDQPTKYNLAVIAPENKFVIDFDDWEIYLQWAKQVPESTSHTYTEITPNMGAHVFLSGTIPPDFKPIKHVEIKRVVLVAPSMVNEVEYEIMFDDPICVLQAEISLFPLSESPRSEPAQLPITSKRVPDSGSLLDAIKCKFSILELMRKHFSKIKVLGHGRFVSACCPFHEEKEPSFWIDTERNLFGCHACGAHGDVINFYARIHRLDNYAAIKEMTVML